MRYPGPQRRRHVRDFMGLKQARRVGMSKGPPPWLRIKCVFDMTWNELVRESHKIVRRDPFRTPRI